MTPPPSSDQIGPESRLEFETLIADTSAALMNAEPADVDRVADAALERLRLFFAVDRAGLLAVSDDRATVRISHSAYGPGVPHVPTTFDIAKAFPWSHRLVVVEERPLIVSRLADLPPDAAADQAAWRALGAMSNLTLPITVGRALPHLITMASLTREIQWPEEYLPRVRLFGEMLVGAVLRARVLSDLRAAHDELDRLRERTEQENVYLRREIAHRTPMSLLVGTSEALRQTVRLATQVAPTNTTVLLTGETGTGKERFASFIHEASERRNRSMVRVNCSAIPSALIESELFGREKGAYTGALTRQIGRFELAHGSTLFLDEIGDLPLDVQVKLLRVLQERTLERLGSPTPIPVDVRIIAATNRDLDTAVRAGTFRSDLFYRVNVFPISVPPLRARREDLGVLVDTLMEELSVATRKRFSAIDPASLVALSQYDWPGNVRELRNVLERAMILCQTQTLTVDVPGSPPSVPTTPSIAPRDGGPPAPAGGLRALERAHILRVLQDTGWRVRGTHGAAAVLGLKPTTLEKRMARLGIRRPSAGHRREPPHAR